MIPFPRRQYTTFYNPLPIQTVKGTVCTYVHFRVTYKKLFIFTNVGVQTDDIHIPDLFPLLDSVVGFRSFGFTPYKASRILIGELFT